VTTLVSSVSVLFAAFLLFTQQFKTPLRTLVAPSVSDLGLSSVFSRRAQMALNQVANAIGDDNESIATAITLEQLARESQANHDVHHDCTWPFVEVKNRIVSPEESNLTIPSRIPRQIHVAWVHHDPSPGVPNRGRCLHYRHAQVVNEWKQRLPNYSVYFHDDYMVDKLLRQDVWPEFPELSKMMQCVQMRSAMLVDVWRQLVLYKFGGFYADMDMVPSEQFTEETILPHVDFFCFSDGMNRPGQWAFGMAPACPVGYFTMEEIFKRIWEMPDVSAPKLVFVTGPDSLKHGYSKTFYWKKETIYNEGLHTGMHNTTAHKYRQGKEREAFVTYENFLPMQNTTGNMTVKDEIKADTGVLHWTEERNNLKDKANVVRGSCRDYLYDLERQKIATSGRL